MTTELTLNEIYENIRGLIYGRGVSPTTLAQWILEMPVCVEICSQLEIISHEYTGSDQHFSSERSSIKYDVNDLQIFKKWFKDHHADESDTFIQANDDLDTLMIQTAIIL